MNGGRPTTTPGEYRQRAALVRRLKRSLVVVGVPASPNRDDPNEHVVWLADQLEVLAQRQLKLAEDREQKQERRLDCLRAEARSVHAPHNRP